MISFLDPLIELVRDVGESILEFYASSRQFSVTAKADASPLTQADIVAHEKLVAGLNKLTPNIPVLSEEGSAVLYAQRKQWQRYWLIDPLDGTKDFLRHSGDFAINIALIENHQPIFGLIYIPVTAELYYAAPGQGVVKQNAERSSAVIRKSTKYKEKIRIIVGHGYKVEKLQNIIADFQDYEVITVGSSIKFCYLAEGKADIYPRLGQTYEWDTAAGQILVEEAGGAVVDFAGQPLRYNTKDSLLNPHFLAVADKSLLQQIKSTLGK